MSEIWQQRQAAWAERNAALEKMEACTSSPRDQKDRLWNKACNDYLKANSLCNECDKRGHVMPADYVGHIVNPKGNPVLFWDMNNWQALCRQCHRRLIGTIVAKIPNPVPESARFYTVK